MAIEAIQATREATQAVRDVALSAIQAVQEAVRDQRPAARHFAAPIGLSAATVAIGNPETAFILDKAAKEKIDFEPDEDIRDAQTFTVKFSELDLKAGSGKAEIHGHDPKRRYQCAIADPVVRNAQNNYSNALNDQTWLEVSAKPHFQDSEIQKLTILDAKSASGR